MTSASRNTQLVLDAVIMTSLHEAVRARTPMYRNLRSADAAGERALVDDVLRVAAAQGSDPRLQSALDGALVLATDDVSSHRIDQLLAYGADPRARDSLALYAALAPSHAFDPRRTAWGVLLRAGADPRPFFTDIVADLNNGNAPTPGRIAAIEDCLRAGADPFARSDVPDGVLCQRPLDGPQQDMAITNALLRVRPGILPEDIWDRHARRYEAWLRQSRRLGGNGPSAMDTISEDPALCRRMATCWKQVASHRSWIAGLLATHLDEPWAAPLLAHLGDGA